jgi:imidazolonepropionase-like amidohydrolase
MKRILTILLAASASLPLTAGGALDQTAAGSTLVRDVRVFDGEHVIEHRSVLFADKIIEIGGPTMRAHNAAIVEGRNRTLLPALFDSHLHVGAEPEPVLQQLASFGVTTALDMFGSAEMLRVKQRIESADPPDIADLRAAGIGAVAPGGMLTGMMRQPLPTLAGPDEADSWVNARIAEGSDYIKIIFDPREGGPLSVDTVKAIVQSAHARGRLVVVHALDERRARDAINAGADGLAHLFLGDSAGTDFGQFAAQHHVFVIPTLITLDGLCGNPQGPALLADSLLASHIPPDQRAASVKEHDASRQHLCQAIPVTVRRLVGARVPILAGTDTGLATGRLLGVVAYGATLHVELKLLVDAGLTPVQALTGATSAAAPAFRFNDRGLIRSGMRADLMLADGDPTRDILATRRIVEVWKRGARVTHVQ